MKAISKTFLLITLLFCLSSPLLAQSDMQIFGFFQAGVTRLNGGFSAVATVPKSIFGTDMLTLDGKNDHYTSLSIQQLNLFVRKELTPKFTAWVNFEISGSYNSANKWGSFSLEEAWVNYQSSDALNVKVGLSIPRFAYLNEIKNKMPLLPYITRPLVYESTMQGTIETALYVPEKAFVQVFGYFPLGEITLDYSGFVGPSEKAYIDGSGKTTGGLSVDTTNFKLFGGRVGLKISDLRLGVSFTTDKQNLQSSIKQDVPRTRIAFDLGYSIFNFFVDGEYISVKLDPENTTQAMNKQFYYATVGYNFSDELFAYGSYSYLKDESSNVLNAGMEGLIFGAGYKPTDSVVFKVGYSTYTAKSSFPFVISPLLPPVTTNVNVDYKAYQLAVSVLF